MTGRGAPVELILEDPPPCARCGGHALLRARYPHAWTTRRGAEAGGLRESVLCPACDHHDPTAAEVLALFTVDGQLDLANLAVFSALAATWVRSVQERSVDLAALAEEEELWRRGDL